MATSTSTNPCHFLSLPVEIRLDIYERLFDTTIHYTVQIDFYSPQGATAFSKTGEGRVALYSSPRPEVLRKLRRAREKHNVYRLQNIPPLSKRLRLMDMPPSQNTATLRTCKTIHAEAEDPLIAAGRFSIEVRNPEYEIWEWPTPFPIFTNLFSKIRRLDLSIMPGLRNKEEQVRPILSRLLALIGSRGYGNKTLGIGKIVVWMEGRDVWNEGKGDVDAAVMEVFGHVKCRAGAEIHCLYDGDEEDLMDWEMMRAVGERLKATGIREPMWFWLDY